MEYTFIDPVPEDCVCTICGAVLTQPVLTECCGQHFCDECLQSWFRVGHTHTHVCPHCRREGFRHIRSLPMVRRIGELRVACPLGGLGCEETFPLREVSDHLSTCGYMLIHCSNNCGEIVHRKDFGDHLEGCTYRPIRTDDDDHMTESPASHSTHTTLSWTSETTLCSPTFTVHHHETHLLLQLTPEQGPRELLRKRQDGTLSLILEREGCQSLLSGVEIRVEEVGVPDSALYPPPPPLRVIRVVCDECDPGDGGNHSDGVVFRERLFGHCGLKQRLMSGLEVLVSVWEHNCSANSVDTH